MKLLKLSQRLSGYYLDSVTKYHIISYPKSGRTWTKYFLSKYFQKKYSISDFLDFKTLIRRHRKIPRFDFTHSSYVDKDLSILSNYIDSLSSHNVIFIARDPRDIVVSFYHHTQNRQPMLSSEGMPLSDFIKHPQLGISRVVDYMNLWMQSRDSFNKFLLVKYEDLNSPNGIKSFEEVVEFLQEGRVDLGALEHAYQESHFKKMQEKEKNSEIDNKVLQTPDALNIDSYKVRKGQVGAYVDEMSQADIEYCNLAVSSLDKRFFIRRKRCYNY